MLFRLAELPGFPLTRACVAVAVVAAAALQMPEVDAAPAITFGEFAQQLRDISHIVEMPSQRFLIQRLGCGEQQCLDQPQLLCPLAQAGVPSPATAALRR